MDLISYNFQNNFLSAEDVYLLARMDYEYYFY